MPETRDIAIHPPRSSGVTIDSDRPERAHQVPPGQRFLVHGTFPLRNEAGRFQGPSVLASIQKPGAAGQPVIIGANSAMSFADDKDRHLHWFEIELTAPTTAGAYRLELRPMAPGLEAEILMFEVAEPSA
jgi:hypothetical protein